MGSQSSLGSRPRRGSTDGKPKRQSKLQYVLETLSACSLFVMSQRPRGAGTPHPHPIQLPSCVGIIYRKLIFGRVGGKAWRQSISTTDIGRFPSCLEATNNNKSQYLALMKCWPLFWALYPNRFSTHNSPKGHAAAAAAAKSLQLCPTVRSQRRQPTRLPHPWDSPGKNTGVGCHFLLQCIKVKSCPTLRPP